MGVFFDVKIPLRRSPIGIVEALEQQPQTTHLDSSEKSTLEIQCGNLFSSINSTMAPAVTVTYNLSPPEDTPLPANMPADRYLEFPLADADASNQKAYYAALKAAVLEAKSALGEQLTAWRDAVGKLEDKKEAKIPKTSEGDEEEEDDVDEE
ncbi:hypothetical protein BN946_scf184867.g13 [Trametes cinnabarina]|uniref:Uncharacterized protein n=1 Tax=Pycnoporus cinnabarinus TaxID=5643 RepID=A0A060SJ49_PYCCI|nr:hypothetical protein BN946_scf184867.g13 [Trametes cinnabarina]